MVHALRGIWRVLGTFGTLVDLRPLSARYPVEVVTAHTRFAIGELEGTGMAAEDAAADRAVRHVVDQGWFIPRRQAQLELDVFWDTIPEMTSFIGSSRRIKQVLPSCADWQAAQLALDTDHPGRTRLQCRRPTLLAVYGKVVP